MPDNQQQPVTRADLDEALGQFKNELRDELVEKMREIETNLLGAFHSYARGVAAQI